MYSICGLDFSFKCKNYTTASVCGTVRGQDCYIQDCYIQVFVYLFVAYLTTICCGSYYRSVDLWNDLRFGFVFQCDTFSLCFSRATENPHNSSVRVVGVPTEIRSKHFLFIGVDNGKSSEFVSMSSNKVNFRWPWITGFIRLKFRLFGYTF